MKYRGLPDIHSLSDFQRDAKGFIARMKRSRKPQVLTVRGKTAAIMLDEATWNEFQETLDLLDSVDGIREAFADMEAGRHKPVKEAFAEIRREVAQRRVRRKKE